MNDKLLIAVNNKANERKKLNANEGQGNISKTERLKYPVIGEIRETEAEVMLKAMTTGSCK